MMGKKFMILTIMVMLLVSELMVCVYHEQLPDLYTLLVLTLGLGIVNEYDGVHEKFVLRLKRIVEMGL